MSSFNPIDPKNAFTTLSYNLGSSGTDYEFLLAQFHEPINQYLKAYCDYFSTGKVASDESKEARSNFIIDILLLDELISQDATLRDLVKNLETDQSLTPEEKKRVMDNIKENPKVQELLLDEKLNLLKIATQERGDDFTDEDLVSLIKHKNARNLIADKLIERLRNRAESSATQEILDSPTFSNPDVIFLQEVGKKNRQFIEKLKTKNYVLKHMEKESPDGAIALNPNRFDINTTNNYSCVFFVKAFIQSTDKFESQDWDCAICVATDNVSGKRFAFVSGHIPGFDYSANGELLQKAANAGNEYCQKLLKKLEEIKKTEKENGTPVDSVIIGADVNGSPEKIPSRFEILKLGRVKVKRTNSPTNTHAMDATDKEREIDFFMTEKKLSTLAQKIKYFFLGGEKIKVSAKTFKIFSFEKDKNMSDHKPILGRVTFGKESLFNRIRKYFSNLRIFKKNIS